MKNLFTKVICLFLAMSSVALYAVNSEKVPGIVRIETGLISGVKSKTSNVVAYKGIPFATPPVGDLRWRAPQPAKSWRGIKKCDAYGASPMQANPVPFMVYTPEFLIPETPISEDCLYLNVFTSANKAEKKPVFVWIYGGGFGSGGAGVPIYDGEAMAKKGIVFVSINYRVGIFGFLAHPDLAKESPDNASGNYGLLDQLAALQWVQKNIAAFGGDPANVTIAGQSAGSMSVNCLVASPLGKGLFSKAIAESGSLMVRKASFQVGSADEANQQGIKLAQSVNATSLTELRAVPAADLMKFPGRYGPIVDGYVLPQSIPEIFAQGKQNNVPVLTGWNHDEAFVSAFKNKDEFIKQAKDTYGADADEFLKYFPATTNEEAKLSQIKLSRDLTFALSGYKWGKLQSQQGKAPVYVYNFNRKLPATAEYVKYGAFHTGEVAYIMDNLKFLHRPWQPQDHQLAGLMSACWVNFIKTGNPNGKGIPAWPKYNSQTNQAMVFDVRSGAANLPSKGELEFLLSQTDKN